MKNMLFTITLCLIFTIFTSCVDAEEGESQTDQFAIELLYKHFESHYTPKDMLHKARKEAIYIAGEFKKGEDAGKKALEEFNHPFTRWNQMDGLQPFSQILDLSQASIVAHPNPALHKPLLNKKNLLMRYKDHAGRLVGVEGLEKIKINPKGTWIFQYTTWIKSKSKIAAPLYVLNAFVVIPETHYCTMVTMPYRSYSIEEMDKTIAYLDSMVEHWLTMN